MYISKRSGMDHTVLPMQIHNACLVLSTIFYVHTYFTQISELCYFGMQRSLWRTTKAEQKQTSR